MKIKRLNQFLKNSWQILVLVLVAVVLAVTLRVFVFSTFKIPSPSMEPALKSGDYIIVNKLIPGARIFKDYAFVENNSKPRFWRLNGIRKIERNDVLVFNFPYSTKGKLSLDINKYYVKRCIAIPGDTFYIDNGIYKVKGCKDTLGNIANQKRMSKTLESDFKSNEFQCFPKRSQYHWNLKFFGPLYVPRKGDCLSIDTMNIALYRQLIEYESEKHIKQKGAQVLLNDSCIFKYTFQTNYYFMSGDHVRDSRDSRYWGLLPEDHIVGKASIIWKSEDKYSGEIRWDRVMSFIK